jgi:hypothetical protein
MSQKKTTKSEFATQHLLQQVHKAIIISTIYTVLYFKNVYSIISNSI